VVTNQSSCVTCLTNLIESSSWKLKSVILSRLANNLIGISCQRLLRGTAGSLVPVYELLVSSPTIRKVIRDEKFDTIWSAMSGGENVGMQTFNQSLVQQLLAQHIDMKTAFSVSADPEDLNVLLARAGV
jgi:twitching motility protein PilT